MKFARGGAAPLAPATSLNARPATAEDAPALGRIFANPTAPRPGRLIGRPGWRVHKSFGGGQPAGAGAVFAGDGMAWLDWRIHVRYIGHRPAMSKPN